MIPNGARRWVKYRLFPLVVAWDLFVNGAFWAELRAVYSGIYRHERDLATGKGEYFIRRHTHMLEKGLSMRPRRSTFAEGYIEQLVSRTGKALANDSMDGTTETWVRDVLDAYFSATEESSSIAILRARESYATFQTSPSVCERMAPAQARVTTLPGDVPTLPELTSLVLARESVRWFAPRDVEREIVDNAITVAMESPSACNRLPYRYIVLDNPRAAQSVAGLVGGTAGYLQNIRAVIAVVGDLSAYAHSRDRHLIYVDAGLSVMSLLLGFQAQGVSTCCINWPDLRKPDRAAADILGLNSSQRVVMLVAYGYADPEGLVPASGKRRVSAVRTYGEGEVA